MMDTKVTFEDVMAYLTLAAGMGQLDRGKREQIVGMVRFAQERDQAVARSTLRVGMRVEFKDKYGMKALGIIQKVNPKNVDVKEGSPAGRIWRCPPAMLKVVG